MDPSSTEIRLWVNARQDRVYQALITEESISHWMVPGGMFMTIHEFSGGEGGTFRISLIYGSPEATGKTTAHTDTYHGRFVELIPNEKVIEEVEFETAVSLLQGVMTITYTLSDKDGGTEIRVIHEHLPPGLSPEDNEIGWRMSLSKLAVMVEADPKPADH